MAQLDLDRAPHGGNQRHLPEWQSQPRITPTTIIDHSIVGTGESAWWHFADRSNLESHFIVCGAGDRADGWIWQLVDTDHQADANLNANGYAISIETGDKGDPDRQPWTPNQLDSLIWLHAELRRIHPTIPNRRSRSCADPAGHGFHTMHGAPSCWTPVSKSCPGTIRKTQWAKVLLPAYLTGVPPEEDDMFGDDDRKKLDRLVTATLTKDPGGNEVDEAVLAYRRLRSNKSVPDPASSANLQTITGLVGDLAEQVTRGFAAVGIRLDAIEELVTPPEPPA